MKIVTEDCKKRIVHDPSLIEAIQASLEHPVKVFSYPGEIVVQILQLEGYRRVHLLDSGKEHLGPKPGEPCYGPGGVDTGW